MTRRHVASLLLATALGGCTFFIDTDKLDPLKDPAGFAQAYGDGVFKYALRCAPFSRAYADLFVSYYFIPPLQEEARASQAADWTEWRIISRRESLNLLCCIISHRSAQLSTLV